MIKYQSGNEDFDRTFENALNGIPVENLTKRDIRTHERWVNDHWGDLNSAEAVEDVFSAASLLGRKGGSVKSERKAASSRENAKKGGRPKKQ